MPHCLPRIQIILLLFLAGSCILKAQNKSWYQFTTTQGLPSNEVYNVIQDHHGYLWFVTKQGICRFDGYEFKSPVDTTSYSGSEAFVPFEDEAGRIWFARLDATLWYVENDTVRPWIWNEVLKPYRDKNFRILDQLAIDKNGTVWMAISPKGLLFITKEGKSGVVRLSSDQNFVAAKIAEKLIYTEQFPRHDAEKVQPNQKMHLPLFYISKGDTLRWPDIYYEFIYSTFLKGVWEIGQNEFILDAGGKVFYISQNQIEWSSKRDILSEKILGLEDGSILSASYTPPNSGLFRYSSLEQFKTGHPENLLKGQRVTDVFIDREGGWWATTHTAGVFYCKNPNLVIYDQANGLPANEVSCLATDQTGSMYVGLKHHGIRAVNASNGNIQDIKSPALSNLEIWDLQYEPSNHLLWSTSPLMYMNEAKHWSIVDWSNKPFNNSIITKEISFDSSSRYIYGSLISGFVQIDTDEKEVNYLSVESLNLGNGRTFSILPHDENHYWVTTSNGLQWWNKDHYEPPPFDHPALRLHPRILVALPGGGMVIGLQGGGILIRDSGKRLTHLTTKDGLTSNVINKIKVTPDGNILVCTSAGLNWLTKNNESWQIKNITEKQGLPSNQVNDAEYLNGEIWAGTDKGLAHFNSISDPLFIPSPVIEEIKINNQLNQERSNSGFSFDQRNISIQYLSLHFKSGGNILYRYRLIGADTAYTMTTNRVVNFSSLAPGDYRFEVQAQNEDRSWSPPATWQFSIEPPWYQTWWALLAALFAVGMIIWVIMNNRLKGIKEKAKIESKIRELELSALRAQMNPHFIFNCLGSIQQFIAENDSTSATRYLARFAKLVRLALHSSVDGKHTLSEEIEMLDNYLALEQMRFTNKFQYSISCEEGLEAEDLAIPPMLVQPFVENAILHGMAKKTEGGHIRITFKKFDQEIEVIVEDNGPGISSSSSNALNKGHKSIGITLTQHRLDLLAGPGMHQNYKTENILDANQNVIGTRVIILIPLE